MLVSIIVTLIVVGFLLWLVNTYIPMDGRFKQLINVLAVVAIVLWVVQALTGYVPF